MTTALSQLASTSARARNAISIDGIRHSAGRWLSARSRRDESASAQNGPSSLSQAFARRCAWKRRECRSRRLPAASRARRSRSGWGRRRRLQRLSTAARRPRSPASRFVGDRPARGARPRRNPPDTTGHAGHAATMAGNTAATNHSTGKQVGLMPRAADEQQRAGLARTSGKRVRAGVDRGAQAGLNPRREFAGRERQQIIPILRPCRPAPDRSAPADSVHSAAPADIRSAPLHRAVRLSKKLRGPQNGLEVDVVLEQRGDDACVLFDVLTHRGVFDLKDVDAVQEDQCGRSPIATSRLRNSSTACGSMEASEAFSGRTSKLDRGADLRELTVGRRLAQGSSSSTSAWTSHQLARARASVCSMKTAPPCTGGRIG